MIKSIFKGVMYAVVATLALVLLFALIIKWANLDDAAIKPVVQVVKVICIFFGTVIAVKHAQKAGWLYGAVVGALYMVLTFLVFSAIDGNFAVDITALNDLLFSVVAGMVSEVLVRMRGSREIEI